MKVKTGYALALVSIAIATCLLVYSFREVLFLQSQNVELTNQSNANYDIGYGEGNLTGYDLGYKKGFDKGHFTGYDFGYNKGYPEGYVAGNESGYQSGYIQGIIDGIGEGYNIRDPTYLEMLQFIALDQTDKNLYNSQFYNCFDFTADVEAHAFAEGYRCGFVYIEFHIGAHAIVAFDTIDKGLTFVEPQTDEIVTLIVGQLYLDQIVMDFTIVW